LLATGNEEGEIDMYDIETGKPLSSQYQIPEDTASRHTAKITAMHWIRYLLYLVLSWSR
jgi:hypothetical protein